MRMKGSVTLKPDWEWRDRLPARDRAACWLCAGWLLLAFGYGRSRVRRQQSASESVSWFASVWGCFARTPAKR